MFTIFSDGFLVSDGQQGSSCGPQSCMDIPRSSQQYVTVTLTSGLEVVCDTWTDGGGWLVIQRRQSADLDFYRDWKDYKFGFRSDPQDTGSIFCLVLAIFFLRFGS